MQRRFVATFGLNKRPMAYLRLVTWYWIQAYCSGQFTEHSSKIFKDLCCNSDPHEFNNAAKFLKNLIFGDWYSDQSTSGSALKTDFKSLKLLLLRLFSCVLQKSNLSFWEHWSVRVNFCILLLVLDISGSLQIFFPTF